MSVVLAGERTIDFHRIRNIHINKANTDAREGLFVGLLAKNLPKNWFCFVIKKIDKRFC